MKATLNIYISYWWLTGFCLCLSLPALAQKKTEIITREVSVDLSYLHKNENHVEDFSFDSESNNYLLLLAVDKYTNWRSLDNPVKDAHDLKKVLQKRYGFKREHTYTLFNEEVTAENIQAKFSTLKKEGTNIDNLIIYYSGHGSYNREFEQGYWVPSDDRKRNYISNQDIINYIKVLKFRHIFLVVDACFSGSLFAGKSRGYIEKKEEVKSRWGLSSGGIEEVLDGKKGDNSPFAYYLIKFLKENLKDKFPVSELIQYVKVTVANNTKQLPKGEQLQGVGSEGGELIFHHQDDKGSNMTEKDKDK